MLNNNAIPEHYKHGDLLNSIQLSLSELGKTINNVTIDDLAPVDEFHIGGRSATDNLLNQLKFTEQDHILDVGCGLGGTSRFIANRCHNHVTGIDLTAEYIETGKALTNWVGLEHQVSLQQGSAADMPFENEMFDGALMLHVGMNIEDKDQLFSEVYRVLKPGALFGIYDIMQIGTGDIAFPVPWASDESISKLATPRQYRDGLDAVGFEVVKENNRRDFALEFFKQMRSRMEANGGPPPLGLHTLMRETTPVKIKNMVDNIAADLIAPVEMIMHKH